MTNTKKRCGLVAVCLALGLFVWIRELASWRPQKIGVWTDARLVEDLGHGPWIVTSKQLINVESGHEITVPANATETSEYHFSPDGRTFAFTGEAGGNLCIEWRDCASGRLLRKFDKFFGNYESQSNFTFQFLPEGKSLILTADNGVEISTLNGSKFDFFTLPDKTGTASLSSHGKWLFIPKGDGGDIRNSKIYDLSKRRLQSEMQKGRGWVMEHQFSPDGNFIIISDTNGPGEDSGTWIADVKTGHKLRDIATPFRYDFDFPFSPDSQRIVVPNSSGERELRITQTGKTIRKLPSIFGSSTFAPDGNFLYVRDENGVLWKIRVR